MRWFLSVLDPLLYPMAVDRPLNTESSLKKVVLRVVKFENDNEI